MNSVVDIAAERTLGTRTFDADDQAAFAQFSGDWNPMHMDPVAARRTQAGAPVVHGIHNFLWAMEMVARAGVDLSQYGTYKVQFQKFALVGVPVTVSLREGDKFRVDVRAGGALVLGVTAKPGNTALQADDEVIALTPAPPPTAPVELELSEMQGQASWLAPPDAANAEVPFPALSSQWGAQRVSAIALLSTVVGMSCPGLHSIFTGFTLKFGDLNAGKSGLGFRCTSADERFRAVSIRCVANGMTADVSAFARIPPVATPRVSKLRGRLDRDFSDRVALIIGGSRGLGAATAKLVAAAGGRVLISYAVGKDDAQAVVDEIRAECGANSAHMFRYDARQNARSQLEEISERPTDIFYFATGRIGSIGNEVFDRELFDAHADIYLSGFSDLCAAASNLWKEEPIDIVYPSTIAIEKRPSEMIEYAMVKAAGEILCQELAKAYPRLRIRWPRIPRVLTDQTATVAQAQAAEAVDVMQRILNNEDPGLS